MVHTLAQSDWIRRGGPLCLIGDSGTGKSHVLIAHRRQRERFEDWLEMGRDLVRRGLRAPMLVVTDGAPGLIRAMEELWPDSHRHKSDHWWAAGLPAVA